MPMESAQKSIPNGVEIVTRAWVHFEDSLDRAKDSPRTEKKIIRFQNK